MCTRFLSYVLLLKPDGEMGGPISHDDGDGVDYYISLLLCVYAHDEKVSWESELQFTPIHQHNYSWSSLKELQM